MFCKEWPSRGEYFVFSSFPQLLEESWSRDRNFGFSNFDTAHDGVDYVKNGWFELWVMGAGG